MTGTHQPCRRCQTVDSKRFREARAQICEGCRPAFELERFGRACFGCHVRKLPDEFPVGDGRYGVGKRNRRRPYCHDCLRIREEDREQRAIERRATWKNYRGEIVRRCSGCKVVKPLTHEHFYIGGRARVEGEPDHFDYRCKTCRGQASNDYIRDKRLQGDEHFLARARAAQRRYLERHPERVRASRQRYERRRRAGEVVAIRQRQRTSEVAPRVPRQPFLDWVEETMPKYPGVTEFADLIGIPARSLLRLRSDRGEWLELDTVDRALQLEGGTMLHELYPDLYDEKAA